MKIVSMAAAVCVATALVAAQDAIPAPLQAMADTERAFARAATAKGIRDSFLEFFADDSIAFNPSPISAKARLQGRPSQPFSVQELTWEPRTGDVAASGEIGWLTGPSTFVDHAAGPDATPQHGNYLSVWRKQADDTWRVFIDVGSSLPAQATFQPGFTRFQSTSRYTRKEDKTAASASLTEADRALDADLRTLGAAKAYAARLTASSRLHRSGSMPTIGAAAIGEWLAANAPTMTATSTTAEASSAGDLGYSYGLYEVTGAKPESGAYVRIWIRDTTGKWLIAVDITQPH